MSDLETVLGSAIPHWNAGDLAGYLNMYDERTLLSRWTKPVP